MKRNLAAVFVLLSACAFAGVKDGVFTSVEDKVRFGVPKEGWYLYTKDLGIQGALARLQDKEEKIAEMLLHFSTTDKAKELAKKRAVEFERNTGECTFDGERVIAGKGADCLLVEYIVPANAERDFRYFDLFVARDSDSFELLVWCFDDDADAKRKQIEGVLLSLELGEFTEPEGSTDGEPPPAAKPVEPVDPKPTDPVDTKPVDPKPVDPVDTKPVDPKPVDPVDPKPVDPVDPKPVDPVDPKPVDPAQAGWTLDGITMLAPEGWSRRENDLQCGDSKAVVEFFDKTGNLTYLGIRENKGTAAEFSDKLIGNLSGAMPQFKDLGRLERNGSVRHDFDAEVSGVITHHILISATKGTQNIYVLAACDMGVWSAEQPWIEALVASFAIDGKEIGKALVADWDKREPR